MKKVLKFILLAFIFWMVGALAFLAARYSPTYVYRLVAYNVADVFDYKHFENRHIKPTENTFSFKYKLDENYVGSLFFDKIISTGHKSLDEWATASQTTALIVIRKDTILYEKYFNGFGRESYFHSQSMAKSFISLLIGFAIEDGYINNIDEPITNYIPELGKRDIKFKQITIRNLLMMQSGLKYNTSFLPILNIHAPWHDEAVGYYHENVRQLLLDKVKISGEPGKKFQYCNYNTSYLGLVIERATGKTVSGYLEEKLWSQVMGYEAMFSVDSKKSGFEYMPSRLIARAIDYARFGRLFLNNGNWDGKQLFPETWARESTLEDKSVPPGQYPSYWQNGCKHVYYKYQWWGHSNCDSTYQFFASGNLGQSIYIIPHQDMVIVHCGNSNAQFDDVDLWHVERCIKYQDFHQAVINKGVKMALEEFSGEGQNLPNKPLFEESFINRKGYSYLDAGLFDDAKLLFALNIKNYPHSWKGYFNMGDTYQATGDLEMAKAYYQKAFELDPENSYIKEKLQLIND